MGCGHNIARLPMLVQVQQPEVALALSSSNVIANALRVRAVHFD